MKLEEIPLKKKSCSSSKIESNTMHTFSNNVFKIQKERTGRSEISEKNLFIALKLQRRI